MPTTAMPNTTPSSLTHTGLHDAFAKGDYTAVALNGDPNQWQTLAARCLIGNTRSAPSELEQFDDAQAKFYAGVGHWMDGNDTRAETLLAQAESKHAQNLLKLIRQERIRVLAQLLWTRQSDPYDLLSVMSSEDKFKVSNIGFHPQDLQNGPYKSIEKHIDPRNPPDFYACAMLEWHHVPIDIQQLSCPIIAHTLDYDATIQTVQPWLGMFDEMIVPDHHHSEIAHMLASSPVSTYPKIFAVHDMLPALPPGNRPLDVIADVPMSHPWHLDRAAIVHQLLDIDDIELRFVDRSVPERTYYELLRHAKICVVHNRHMHDMIPATIEALSMGCAVLVEDSCIAPAYLTREHGVFTYGPTSGSLASVIRDILNRWPQLEASIHQGAEVVRKDFARSRVMSQYLRYLTFLAAKPRPERRPVPTERLSQKRAIRLRGCQTQNRIDLLYWRDTNTKKWNQRFASGLDQFTIIDIARALVLEYSTECERPQLKEKYRTLLDGVLKLYETGITHFPKSLVMRFNLIRTALHFGTEADICSANKLLKKTLHEPKSYWRVDPKENVFPYDFQSECFNYRNYFNLLLDMHANKSRLHRELIRLILASMNYYKGMQSASMDHLKKAIELDPEFPFYHLAYAKHLAATKSVALCAEAGEILTDLAKNSSLFIQAFEVLEQMRDEGLYANNELDVLAQRVLCAQQNGIVMQDRWEGIV